MNHYKTLGLAQGGPEAATKRMQPAIEAASRLGQLLGQLRAARR